MSKQKTVDSPETENEVTEKLVEQNELDGLSSTTTEVAAEEVTTSTSEIVTPVKAKVSKVTTVVETKGNSTGKMGVKKFLMLYPQDIYIETWLKNHYPKSSFTKDEWFMRIEELLNMNVNS